MDEKPTWEATKGTVKSKMQGGGMGRGRRRGREERGVVQI